MPVRDPKTPSSKHNPMAPSPYWGDEADLGQPDQHPQPDVGREGPGLVHVARPPAGQPGLLQEGLGPSLGQGVPARTAPAGTVDVRSEDRQVHADQHLLPDPSSDLRRGCQQHAVDQPAGRAAASSAGSNRKMFEETGDEEKSQGWTPLVLDTNGNGKRDDYVEPNQPVDPAKDKRIAAALYGIGVNPLDGIDLGHGARLPRLHRPARSRRRSDGRLRSPKSTSRRCPATARAAATSTATASSGCRWRAATSASFDRSKCKGRSTDRPRPASIAPRAGRSIRSRARNCGPGNG